MLFKIFLTLMFKIFFEYFVKYLKTINIVYNYKRYWSSSKGKCMNCRDGWRSYENTCFKFFAPNKKLDWTEAEESCVSHESTLLTLKEANKFNFFKNVFKADRSYDRINPNNVKAWVGSVKKLAKSFSWDKDGSKVDQNLWSNRAKMQEQRNQTTTEVIEACVGIDAYLDYRLNDLKCENVYAFFCEHECKQKPQNP